MSIKCTNIEKRRKYYKKPKKSLRRKYISSDILGFRGKGVIFIKNFDGIIN